MCKSLLLLCFFFLGDQIIYNNVHFFNPVIDEAYIALLFLLGERHLAAVWLNQDVVLVLLLAPHLDGCLGHLDDLRLVRQGDGAFVILHVFVILQFTVLVQLKESDLFVTIPVLLADLSLYHNSVFVVQLIWGEVHYILQRTYALDILLNRLLIEN